MCVPGYAKKVRAVPAWLKRQAYAEYEITQYKTGDYEVDHLIPLSLGGSNSIRNLWPQSTKTSPWNSYVKDALERKLHKLVCADQLDLKSAQRGIASDRIEAYKKYAGSTPSLVQSSFATWALCTEANAVKVPREAPLELLGPLGCGIQTGARAVIKALRVQAGDRFAVFGVGIVGLSAVIPIIR